MRSTDSNLRRTVVCLLAMTLASAAAAPLSADQVEVRPSKLVVGKSGGVDLIVDPSRLMPKPRSEILYAWWCWDIDPRPEECELHYCDSPLPDDPICAVPKETRAGKLAIGFESQQEILKQAGGACGPTDFILMARLEDGTVSEAEGTVEIDCGR